MILTNVFLSVFLIFNSINIINSNDKTNKYQLSVEKKDVLTLNFNNIHKDLEEFKEGDLLLNLDTIETRPKGILNNNFKKSFEEFYNNIILQTNFLDEELNRLEENSQAYSSEYLFQRKLHIKTQLVSLLDKIESINTKQKKKLICYEYRNSNIDKYNGVLGFSIVYNDKEKPILIGTVVMPEYIGELESLLTIKTIENYKSRYKVHSDYIYAEPLSYLDRYFLNSVGFQ